MTIRLGRLTISVGRTMYLDGRVCWRLRAYRFYGRIVGGTVAVGATVVLGGGCVLALGPWMMWMQWEDE